MFVVSIEWIAFNEQRFSRNHPPRCSSGQRDAYHKDVVVDQDRDTVPDFSCPRAAAMAAVRFGWRIFLVIIRCPVVTPT